MIKIVVGINNLVAVKQFAYSNHSQVWFRFGRDLKDKVDFVFTNPTRMSIDNMRNFCARVAIENKADYLLFIDDDVLLPGGTLERLLKVDADVSAAVTLIRGYPFAPMIFDFKRPESNYVFDYKEKSDPLTGYLACDAVGFSCALIKTSALVKVKEHYPEGEPLFLTGPNFTEDVYFCKSLRAADPTASIVVDCNIWTSHILGDDIISPENREVRMLYEEIMRGQPISNLDEWKTFVDEQIRKRDEKAANADTGSDNEVAQPDQCAVPVEL